jgi:hypothetical protein
VIARVCTRLACTRRHRDRPCLHTPCLHTSSPSTSCMHPHKSAPIDALPRRVPRPWNCHPSVVEVILHRPQEPPPPKPLSPRRRDASSVLRARSRSTVLTPSTPMAVSVLHLHQRDRPGVHGVLHLVQARNLHGCGVQESSKLATPRMRSVTRRGGRSSSSTLKVPSPQAGALPR